MTAGFLENTDINHLRHLGQLFLSIKKYTNVVKKCHLRCEIF